MVCNRNPGRISGRKKSQSLRSWQGLLSLPYSRPCTTCTAFRPCTFVLKLLCCSVLRRAHFCSGRVLDHGNNCPSAFAYRPGQKAILVYSQPLYRNVQWFRGGIVFEARRLLYQGPSRTCNESEEAEEKIRMWRVFDSSRVANRRNVFISIVISRGRPPKVS